MRKLRQSGVATARSLCRGCLTAHSSLVTRHLFALLFFFTPVILPAQATPDSNNAVFRSISNRLLCQCGNCAYMVGSCNHLDCSSATYIRRTIQESLAEGQSEEVIMASFVEQYGPKILAEPQRQGFAWLAWIMPFVGLVVGGSLVTYAIWRLRGGGQTARTSAQAQSQPSAAAPASSEVPPSSSLVEKYRGQIDRDLDSEL